jgi:Mrr N-terminal domain
VAPRILIDDDVLALLKSNAEPFVDTPNTVLRRLLGLPPMNGSMSHEDFVGDGGDEPVTAAPKKTTRQGRRRRRRPASERAQPGTILPHEEYEIPILAILDAHAGRAPTSEVLDELGRKLADRFMPADLDTLATGNIRWRNRAQFVRLRLIERGDMASGSPRGLWEITDQGRDRLVAE